MLINTGMWRIETEHPIQVISGSYGREKVHFEAPNSSRVPAEMDKFIAWFNDTSSIDLVIKAAIAHLWFVTIHPFDDGNGRIARVIADMLLARSENQPERFYSMSAQIKLERKDYYNQLEQTQRGSLDITNWLCWFLQCLNNAMDNSKATLATVLNKAKFWEHNASVQLNQRQVNMLNRLFDGFKGKLTSSKWAKIMKCSQDTASRDINDLIDKGILVKSEKSGRSTNYLLRGFSIHYLD